MKQLVILISGRGSNMQALLDAPLPAQIAAVISNSPAAGGLAIASARGVPTRVVDHRGFSEREAFDRALAQTVDAFAPDLLILAGFMRILTPWFVERYAGRIINIHPSLLPAFTGVDTHRRALEAGVRLHGCTVHFVTPKLDHGPIIVQAAVPVQANDAEEALAARVLAQEHRILPQAVRWFLEGRLHVDGERVSVQGGACRAAAMVCPEEA
jgi:phosphoribosylglycinamide formyltransferase-1